MSRLISITGDITELRQPVVLLGDPALVQVNMIHIDDEPVPVAPLEDEVEQIYASYKTTNDKRHIAESIAHYLDFHPPSHGLDTVCPRKLSTYMQSIRSKWISDVYKTYIELYCIPYINNMLVDAVNTHAAIHDIDLQAMNGFLDIVLYEAEYMVRGKLFQPLIDDFASQSMAFTHPVTFEEIKYWMFMGLETARLADLEDPRVQPLKTFASMRVISLRIVCNTMKRFGVTITDSDCDDIFKEWMRCIGVDTGHVKTLSTSSLVWIDDMKRDGKHEGVITAEQSPNSYPESIHRSLARILDMCIDRFTIWFYIQRGHLDFINIEHPMQKEITKFWTKMQNIASVRTWREKHASTVLGNANAAYRDNVARYNWHENFYSGWVAQSHSYGVDSPSYVARIDNLELGAIEYTASCIGKHLGIRERIPLSRFVMSKLLVPVRNWPVHRVWKTIRIKWEYATYMSHDINLGAPIGKGRTEYAIADRVPHVAIMCSILFDAKLTSNIHVRKVGFTVCVHCTLTGTYIISKGVPDLVRTVEADTRTNILCFIDT
jgi:hypothetical protein